MRSENMDSYISVPVPTALYFSLVDVLSVQKVRHDPVTAITVAIDRLINNKPNSPVVSSRTGNSEGVEWSNDWIIFESPPL